MAEWLQCWTADPEVLGSSPTGTISPDPKNRSPRTNGLMSPLKDTKVYPLKDTKVYLLIYFCFFHRLLPSPGPC